LPRTHSGKKKKEKAGPRINGCREKRKVWEKLGKAKFCKEGGKEGGKRENGNLGGVEAQTLLGA